MDILGYHLELTGTTARLVRVFDDLDASQPARTKSGRAFDRRRYAYLCLVLSAVGRAGIQVALSELAERVAADAGRVGGLGLDTDRAADRGAFVDAVAWLEERGALALADGSARAWADDPERAEALYDIDRDVVAALYRPTRVLQHLRSISALLHRESADSRNVRRREAARRARRAVIEHPVVYFYDDADVDMRNHLRTPALAEDVERLTGLAVERRAEGLALIDTGNVSDRRFPGSGTVAQAAMLLLREIAGRIADDEENPLRRLPGPTRAERRAVLADEIDSGLPAAGILDGLADDTFEPSSEPVPDSESPGGDALLPLLEDGWLRATMRNLMVRYGKTFGVQWRADPDRLLAEALDLLISLRLVARVDGGVLALPLLARYRGVVVDVRKRQTALFAMTDTATGAKG